MSARPRRHRSEIDVVEQRSAVVIGASMAGLCAASALAASGFQVTVLERDELSGRPRNRRGVPQDSQAHILLYRGMTVLEELLPGFRTDLLAAGAVAYDSGRMPWLSEYGWLDTELVGYEVVSATRPLMETVARGRVGGLSAVRLRDRVTVTGLERAGEGWLVRTEAGLLATRLVIDASGRSSRLPHWAAVSKEPTEEEVDARVGYASRLYRERRPMPISTGVMIFASPDNATAGLALPVEDRRWLVAAAGFGDHRPPREEAAFLRFLDDLRDPAIADLVAMLEPAGDVSIHRQTANRRRRCDRVADWPTGLLVVGDALCSLNPVYGQGITVAAQQAQVLGVALRRGRPVDRALQRLLFDATEAPWSIATTADLRQPTCPGRPNPVQRLSLAWGARLSRLAAAGDPRATSAILAVNNLMAPPTSLLQPALVLAAGRPLPSTRLPRPTVLEDLRRARREQPPAGPATV